MTFISVGGGGSNTDFVESLLDTALYMLGSDAPPQVMTTSYGIDEYTVSPKLAEYVEAVDQGDRFSPPDIRLGTSAIHTQRLVPEARRSCLRQETAASLADTTPPAAAPSSY